MEIFLSPKPKASEGIRAVYVRALRDAQELYIATAYLLDWDRAYKLNAICERLVFLVGTDFGLTRKNALTHVLNWMPRHVSAAFFGAVPRQDGNFHPKVVAWKDRTGKCYCMIGSSNLSKAAFSENCEANVLTAIPEQEFARIGRWLDEIAESAVPVSKDWIDHHYSEAKIAKKAGAKERLRIKPDLLPDGEACRRAVRRRRSEEAKFAEIGNRLRRAAARCANGEITNRIFWQTFWNLWSAHPSRLQGRGIEFRGKRANWKQACASLIRILDAAESSSVFELDQRVMREIDHLRSIRNTMRGAWLSEMLCHYFPELYPVRNDPVRRWLSHIKLRARRGTTEGQQYVDLAQKLRAAVKDYRPAGACNLPELDSAIWCWLHDRGLLKKQTA